MIFLDNFSQFDGVICFPLLPVARGKPPSLFFPPLKPLQGAPDGWNPEVVF